MVRSGVPSGGMTVAPTVTRTACGRPVRICGSFAVAGTVNASPGFSTFSIYRSPPLPS